MCLAIPAQIVQLLPDDRAMIDLDGVKKDISLSLVADVAVGDYVIVHVGYAIGKIDAQEARHTLTLLQETAQRAGVAA